MCTIDIYQVLFHLLNIQDDALSYQIQVTAQQECTTRLYAADRKAILVAQNKTSVLQGQAKLPCGTFYFQNYSPPGTNNKSIVWDI